MLDDQPDVGIVEADLERGRRDDKIGVRIDARILGGGPADPQRSLVQVGLRLCPICSGRFQDCPTR
ncbi:hypothetical protein SHIRM173S_06597 [Streptomyces hirsutus]